MSVWEKIKQAYIKDDNGEVNLLTVMITVLMMMFTYLFVKAEILGLGISETITGSVVQLISIAFGGVGVLGGIRTGVDYVNQKRANKDIKTEVDTIVPKKEVKPLEVIKMDNLTKDFRLSEFACKDGTEVPDDYLDNVKLLAENLQALRDYLNSPITITSGYRTESYNLKVGGKPNSQHKLAKAADIQIKGMTPKEVFETIEKLITSGKMVQGAIGLYATFVHYDVRGTMARWE